MDITVKQLKEWLAGVPDEAKVKGLLYSNILASPKRIVHAKRGEDEYVILNCMGTHLKDEDNFKYVSVLSSM